MECSIHNLLENARLIPKLHHPATFLERGVALPFTTPLLAGSRVRPSEADSLELILLNPAGGRGVYILPWRAIGTFCRPTLHDTIFNERVAALPWVTPLVIRRVARAVAAEGLAGEDAVVAAGLATEGEKSDIVLANYQLLMVLYEQAVAGGFTYTEQPGLDHAAKLRAAVNFTSQRLGRSPDWTATALEDLADLMAGLGVSATGPASRLQRQINLLRQVHADIYRWTTSRVDDVQVSCGAMIRDVAILTLQLAETTLTAARELTANMEDLLRQWSTAPNPVRDLLTRPEWLLDGWERICLLWNAASDDTGRIAVIADIADLVPVMPKEITFWDGSHSEEPERVRRRRIVPFNEDWLTGTAVFDLIARNEQLRAAAC